MSVITSRNKYINISEFELLNTRKRLVCFPYAGGGASAFYSWKKLSDLCILPIQLPGRESRISESPHSKLRKVVEEISRDIETILRDNEIVFFGHSMGALLAFEVARQLNRNNIVTPTRLFLSGCSHPQDLDVKGIHKLPDEEFIDELRKRNGTPEKVIENEVLMSIILDYIRADFELCETYLYKKDSKINIPINLLCGKEDSFIKSAGLHEWEKETTKNVSIKFFQGDHFYFKEDRGESLLSYIQANLNN